MSTPPQEGIYVPIPTFFKKDLVEIDFDSQVKHAKFLRDAGIKGLIVMGSTGEAAHLTKSERAQVISTLHKELPDFTIVGGVAQNSVKDAISEIESLHAAGAEYAMVLPSSYFGVTIKQQGIVDFFTQIADKSPIPILIYVYPGVSNNVLVEPNTVIKLSAHPNIVGTKLSYGDVSHHTLIASNPEVKKNNFNTFTGLGQILFPVLAVGGSGTVDALAGSFPKLYVKIFEAFKNKDFEKAAKLQYLASRGEEIVVKFGVIGIKKLINVRGFGETYLGRVPLNQDLDINAWNQYKDTLDDLLTFDKEN